ncbi:MULTISPECIES: antiterminator Q family protein [Pseudomonas]|uniref:Antitermination protein Q n=1 Tax=Pseudomonas idahonensis TaxID=2942628 RepID=A0ABT5Q867_9PSED|nr:MULTISPECIES: antiterminator Q family protein [Pseudomonas]MCO7575333.1 antitermination protein Q [Pseudomonas protegens]MCO7582564.1 antitermination protein Q [Pseudomonas chlororaphis]MCO7599257.1 antitermination protein Q [Pseudomonas chlororaphis]MDD1150389.1 antitermination protein Q [Pseudomonas idahonensis]
MKKRTYTDKPLGDTEYLLEQWGWWRMDGMGVPRYVSPLLAMIRDNVPAEGGAKQYVITDDLALAVDGAVSRLTKRDQQMGDFIWLYFGAKWPMIRVGEKARMSERSAREVIKAGVAWLDCALEQIREAA